MGTEVKPARARQETGGASSLPAISIVVPSKNRFGDIVMCLSSIKRQTVEPAEVIVVDQSDVEYSLPKTTNLVHIYDTTISGLADARNRALSRARGDIILFVDDDTELAPTCVEALAKVASERLDAVGFQIRDALTHYSGRIHPILDLIFEHGFFRKKPIRTRSGTLLTWLEGYAMAVRANAVQSMRFDTMLVGYSLGEDWEFSQRLRCLGSLIEVPGTFVYHHQSMVNREHSRELAVYRWHNFHYFYAKLGADADWRNRIWLRWWRIGESIRWLRAGLGLPKRLPDFQRSCKDDTQQRI